MKRIILPLSMIWLLSAHLYAAEITSATPKTSSAEMPVDTVTETITTTKSTSAVTDQKNLTPDQPAKKQRKVYQEPFLPLSLRTR